jgi:flagellin
MPHPSALAQCDRQAKKEAAMTIDANGNVNGAAAAALSALQSLQLTSTASSQTTGSSGLASGASTSAAGLTQSPLFIFNATSQTSPSQSTADSLSQGASLTDAAGAAAQSLGALLKEIQQTAKAAAEPSLTSASRQDLSRQFASQISGFSSLLASAQINGQNLLNGSLTANPTFALSGGGTVTVQTENLTLGGPLVSLTASASVSTASTAATTASLAGLSLTSVQAAIGRIYDQSDQISSFATQLGASLLGGSSTIDPSNSSVSSANSDSAGLIALQLQQTLSADPSVSLSNPASQAILSLFRG